MFKIIFALFLLFSFNVQAEVLSNTSLYGTELVAKNIVVPEGASVLVTFTASVSHKDPYGRNWFSLRRGGNYISEAFGNREHEDGSTTGLSDFVTVTVVDKPAKAGTFRYNVSWAVNTGTGYVGAKNFSLAVIKP